MGFYKLLAGLFILCGIGLAFLGFSFKAETSPSLQNTSTFTETTKGNPINSVQALTITCKNNTIELQAVVDPNVGDISSYSAYSLHNKELLPLFLAPVDETFKANPQILITDDFKDTKTEYFVQEIVVTNTATGKTKMNDYGPAYAPDCSLGTKLAQQTYIKFGILILSGVSIIVGLALTIFAVKNNTSTLDHD